MAANATVAKVAPHALPTGSTIAFISPSARLNDLLPHCISRAADFLSSNGYEVVLIYSKIPPTYTVKQSAMHRVAEIHKAFMDPSISAIVCTIGGSTCNEMLPHLDYELMKAHPKIFCGYSDITLLHYALYKYANLRTFYGPTAITQWAEFPTPFPFTTEHFLKTITSTIPIGQFPCGKEWTDEPLDWFTKQYLTRPRVAKRNRGWRWIRHGNAEGIMFGGCLPSILRLGGTKYDLPSYRGIILVLELPEGEDRKATPLQRAQSQMCDLANRGVFEDIAGLVIGRSFGFDDKMIEAWDRYTLELTEGKSFPVLSGVDVGHTDPMLTIPFGARGKMDSEKGIWAMVEAGVQ
ncbi:hypothetical protein MMC11_005533 [Xylographa trunciseda]|nr:hypothetical protein [Xylographa trunciseda]